MSDTGDGVSEIDSISSWLQLMVANLALGTMPSFRELVSSCP